MREKIVVAREDAILRVVLNRPDKKNALDREMYGALIEALAQADGDSSLRVVFFQGALEEPDKVFYQAGNFS